MSIAFIYHHHERHRVDPVARFFESRGHVVAFAPVGVEVGTPEWSGPVRTDIQNAEAVMVFLTRLSVQDAWVAWRVKVALDSGVKLIIPSALDDMSDLFGQLDGRLEKHQAIWLGDDSDWERMLGPIAEAIPKPRKQVECFLSYGRADIDFVQRLRGDLAEHGIATWRDLDNIPAGASWDREIEEALSRCSHVLFVLSAKSVESANVADEVSFARERKKAIIPLLLDDSPLPLRVHRAQAIDFRSDYDEAIQELAAALEADS
jgi:hypothetical protein